MATNLSKIAKFGNCFGVSGRCALVTGSTSGIGLGIARTLAANGANIVLHGFADDTTIKSLMKEFNSDYAKGIRVTYIGGDLRDAAATDSLVRESAKFFGDRIDILVNNAGIQHVSPVEQFPDQKWEDVIKINLSSVFYATKAALPFMHKQKWGRIVNVSSVHGLVASANKSAYVAAKHGVMGFTKTVALETAGSGITCNSINPGWVLTPLVQKQIEDRSKEWGLSVEQAQIRLLSEKQPSKQFATPEQIGDLVAFLCSDAAAQITGTAHTVDGGWTSQ